MRCFIGIDLGSTTTKAVVMDEDGYPLGRGITNSRANYDTAAAVSKQEALVDTRLTLCRRALEGIPALVGQVDQVIAELERHFRQLQFLEQLDDLEQTCLRHAHGPRCAGHESALREVVGEVFRRIREHAPALFAPGVRRPTDPVCWQETQDP